MKTQISRNSRQVLKNYSSVCHQQGRMLTDSDLTEQALISRDRLNQALRDVIGSGTPRHDALLRLAPDKTPALYWGRVYVDGVPAEVQADNAAAGDIHFEYTHQLHYPDAPALPGSAYRYYVDVWERPVIWLEDEMLRDPGLHGADTTTRTQTVAQVKYCAAGIDPRCPDINPPRGNALLHLVLRSLSTSTDPCDPCSDELELHDPVGNYLFRAEVHDVHYDNNNLPDAVVLKWSSENGAEAYKTSDVPPDFASNQYHYEFFDEVTEKRLGIHLARDMASERIIDGKRPQLVNAFSDSSPSARDYVRRWDGWCRIDKGSSGWQLTGGFEGNLDLSAGTGAGNPGHVDSDGAGVSIELRVITLNLELAAHAFVTGDYWTAPVRESIHQQGEVLLQDIHSAKGAPPEGEIHHYLLLADVNANGIMTLPADSDCDPYHACQIPQFPSLTDLNTADICYTKPDCGNQPSLLSLLASVDDSFPAHERIKLNQLLNSLLCHTTAATVPLDPEPLCQLLRDEGATTVQDALNIICNSESNGCSTFTVTPIAGWQHVFNRIAQNADAHICFHEGTYRVDKTLIVPKKGHLKISCAGAGTRFIHTANEAVIKFEDCRSVSIDDGFFSGGKSGAGSPQDQSFDHINGALTFSNCGEVNLHRVILRCRAATRLFASCLTVASTLQNPGAVRINACRFEVGHQQLGVLLLNQQRISVTDNQILVRKKPAKMTVDSMLRDRVVAARIRDLMLKGAVVRDFDKLDPTQRKGLQQVQTNKQSGSRQIMFKSSIAGNHWKKAIDSANPDRVYASNNELLATLKKTADSLLRDPAARKGHSAISRWINDLEQQNPAVMDKGIVCAGSSAKEIRIQNNSISGVQMGIQVGVSDRSKSSPETLLVGTTRIQGNSIQVLLSPLASRRRGGVFAGNCTQLTLTDNSVQVQRFTVTNPVRVESLRVFGILGRKMIVKDNFCAHCDVGIRVTPMQVEQQKMSRQWLVADNMFANASLAVEAPDSVVRRNNMT